MKDDAIDIAAADAIADADRGSLRKKLMMLAPLVLIIAGVAYMVSGRYVSTDNAFVRADIADISPEVAGSIQQVLVHDNDVVKAGQPLVKIDSTNYEILLAASDTQLKQVSGNVEAERARYHQNVDELAAAKSQLEYAQRQFERQSRLASTSAGAEATRDASQNALKVARANVAIAESKIKESLADLFGDPDIALENHPAYQQAVAQREVAALQVRRSTIVAPFDGVVSHVPQVGDYARTGVTLLSLVSSNNVWVDANFKETEITFMKNGQDAEITVDAYPGHTWHAHINSLSQATGSEFALLPAQNATGNWVKVVQRVPVRLSIDKQQDGPVLRAGMSVDATVDTGARRYARWFGAAS